MSARPSSSDPADMDDGLDVVGVVLLLGVGLLGLYVGFMLGVIVAVDRWYLTLRGWGL